MSPDKIAKLKARLKRLEDERFHLFDDARYAALLRRFIKEKQWGGVFMVMANYFGADHIGIPPDMQEVMAENKRLQQQVSRLEFANRNRIHDLNQLGGYMEENHRLKAEVAKLRKAGDGMVQLLDQMDVIMDMNSDHPEVEAWNAAKEGKPSE